MNIILFGPPGSGKGTQADNIVKNFNLFKISVGDILRNEININSQIGKEIKSTIDAGGFVSDETVNNLIEKKITNKNYNRLVFDGYPRNISQAKYLDNFLKKHNQHIVCVISLKVDKDTIIKRILGRQICSKCTATFNEFFNPANDTNHPCGQEFLEKRTDDNDLTINKRFQAYVDQTLPILDHYQSKKLLREINGIGDISAIYKEISQIMLSFDT